MTFPASDTNPKAKSASSSQSEASQLPLAGFKVLELGTVIAGPAVGLFLADLGADVVSIENPHADPFQNARPSTAFLKRNKRSLRLDLAREEGKALFLDLARKTDVIVENYGPGVVDRIGVGYEAVSAVNDAIIYCSIKGFLPGPYSKRFAADEVAQMMGGLAFMTGLPGRPMRAGASITDLGAASFATMGILAALLQRQRTGKGQHVQSGLFETVTFWMSQHLAALGVTGKEPQPVSVQGVWHQMRWPIYDVFEVADKRQVFVGILNDKQWSTFCTEFGLASLQANPALQTNEQRLDARPLLLTNLGALFLEQPLAALVARLERAQVLFAPVNAPANLLTDPHLLAGNHLLETHFSGKEFLLPGLPLKSNAFQLGIRRQPASIGDGTLELLTELGCHPQRVADLCEKGVIQLPASN